jgi:hypothetical protein
MKKQEKRKRKEGLMKIYECQTKLTEIGEPPSFQIFAMAAISSAQNLQVEHFCNLVTNTVRSTPLNYNILFM